MDGKCLCGAITLHTPDKTHIDACHCGMCRRWGGGPALGLACGADVTIEGSDKLKVYQSSEWAERAFCGECGTHMFYRLSAHLFILGGTFVHPWRHICSSLAAHLFILGGTIAITGASLKTLTAGASVIQQHRIGQPSIKCTSSTTAPS
jgi:Glutathione-dependent formaldehyde-activating enzyme